MSAPLPVDEARVRALHAALDKDVCACSPKVERSMETFTKAECEAAGFTQPGDPAEMVVCGGCGGVLLLGVVPASPARVNTARGEESIACPHGCGYRFEDLWDFDWSDRTVQFLSCGGCGKGIDLSRAEGEGDVPVYEARTA